MIQLEVLDVYLQQMHVAEQKAEEARQSIKLFMSYVVKEQKLQENLSWNITAGADGKPYLTGATKTK